MSARWLAVSAMALVAAAAQPALADDAKTRGAGTSSSGAGERHHSSSSSSSSGSSSGSHFSAPSSSSSGSPVLTDAQRRHPRAGTGTGSRNGDYGRGGYGYGYGGYGYGYGYRYRPYYGGYGYYPWGGIYFDSYWGSPYYYGGYYGGGYRGGYGGGYYVRSYRDTGSVRVLVDQHKANVFVDGYYAGSVDDFDGIFQRLYVSPGHHAITVKLEGFKTHTFDVYVPYDGTLKLHWEMARGSGDDGTGDPTLNAGARRDVRGDREGRRNARDDRYGRDDNDDRHDRNAEDRNADQGQSDDRYAPTEENRWPRGRAGATGSLHLSVRPDDASIYLDGAFRGTARELSSLDLGAGPHRLEIVRPGYRTVEREVTVESGRSVDLSVSLER